MAEHNKNNNTQLCNNKIISDFPVHVRRHPAVTVRTQPSLPRKCREGFFQTACQVHLHSLPYLSKFPPVSNSGPISGTPVFFTPVVLTNHERHRSPAFANPAGLINTASQSLSQLIIRQQRALTFPLPRI